MAGKQRLFRFVDSASRFWAKVRIGDPVECWRWAGNVNLKGYGHFLWTEMGRRRSTTAHRAAYLYSGQTIPDGWTIDHLCRNRWCVNPAHLDACPHAENVRRGDSGGYNRRKIMCKRGHLYTPDNTGTGSKGERVCRKCSVIHTSRWRLRRKATVAA